MYMHKKGKKGLIKLQYNTEISVYNSRYSGGCGNWRAERKHKDEDKVETRSHIKLGEERDHRLKRLCIYGAL